MSTTLPLFWDLSSSNRKDRINASVKLISTLETIQTSFVPKAPETSEEDEDEENDEDEEDDEEGDAGTVRKDNLELLNASDVSYSIRRLVRGLASPRESSRLGFAVALTELLSRIDTVTCAQILALVLDASKTTGSMSGQEERDALFARLFGLTALVQSGLLVRTRPLPSASAETSSAEAFADVVAHLLALGEKKSFLRESAFWALGLAASALHASDVAWKEEARKRIVQTVFVENRVWGPEKVALAVTMARLWPELEWKKLLAPTFKHGEVLHVGNSAALAKVLKDAAVDEEQEVKGGGRSWKPQVHYVWDLLLDELLPSPESKKASKGSFQEFFRIVVDESLFASSASNERKYWGFEIFCRALPRIKAAELPMLFTKNFMRTWINHLSQHDRYLHTFAKQIATSIHAVVQKDPTIGLPFIVQLTGVHGNQQFDKLTKTKTVESILSTMDVEGIKTYIDHLLKQLNESGADKDDVQVINARRSWIIDQFAGLIKNCAIPKADEWIRLILDWLAVHGLFMIRKKSEKSSFAALHSVPTPPFSDALRAQCRARLSSCFAELTAQSTIVKNGADDKAQKLAGVAADGEFWVAKVLDTIEQLQADTKHVELLVAIEAEERALGTKAQEVVARLRKITGEQHEAAQGAELLLLSALLQQYTADEADESATETLEACIDGASRLFPASAKKSKKSRKSTGADETEGETEPIDVLVDTIIGFLEKATAYMRAVGNQSFGLLSGAVKESTVDLILSQLERRNPKELVADEDEDEEMEVDEEAEEDEEGKEEKEEKEEKEDSKDDEDETSNGEEESDEAGDEEEDPELRTKIMEALRANGIEPATGLSDDESESEEEMDDDQMMAIDDQLAQIFKERAKGKGKDENAQREATHFKNRILDLVDIFMKKQPTSPLIIRLIVPLVDLVLGSGSDEQQLSTKAAGLLRARIGKAKDVPSAVSKEDATQVLKDLHTRARKVHSADALAIISLCSLYLTRVLLHAEAPEPVVEVYRESLTDFVTRKASDLNTKFFDEFIKRHPGAAWGLRNDLLELTPKAVNSYRQAQVFGLIQTLINQLPNIGDKNDEILAFMLLLHKTLCDTVSKACEENTATAAHLKEVLKLAPLAARQTKRYVSKPEDLAKIWKLAAWTELQNKLSSNERFRSSAALLALCKQVVQLTQAGDASKKDKKASKGGDDGVKTGKRKVEEGGEAVAAKKAKRTKSTK